MSFFLLLGVAACGGTEEEAAGGGEGQEANGGGEQAAVADDFNAFDADNNNELSQGEFDEGVFGNLDTDTSGTIGEDEFNAGSETWFGDSTANFNDFDADNNNELSQQEFNEGAAGAGLFAGFDADANDVIDENEFSERSRGGATTQAGGTTMGGTTGGDTMMGTTMGGTTGGGTTMGTTGGETTASESAITNLQTIIDEPNKQSLAGQPVLLSSTQVQDVVGDVTFLVGPSADQTVFAVLGDELVGAQADAAMNIEQGETLAIVGTLQQAPSAQEAQQELGLTQAEVAELQGEDVYLFVEEVEAAQ